MNAYKILLFGALLFSGLFFAAGEIENAFYAVCGIVITVLPIGLLLISVLAAIIYAIGQMMGAETRARATVWATNMFIGAIIAAIIFVLIPYMLETLGVGVMSTVKASCLSAVGAGGSTGCSGYTCTCGFGGSICPTGRVCVNGQCVIASSSCNPPCNPGFHCVNGYCI